MAHSVRDPWRRRKQKGGGQGPREGDSCLMGTELQLGMMESSGDRRWWPLRNRVNVPNATERGTQTWLRWSIVCYVYFATIQADVRKKMEGGRNGRGLVLPCACDCAQA